MIWKRLVILANSIKKHERCLAGREWVTGPNGQPILGEWVRPVSTHGEGELRVNERTVDGKGEARLLDVIDVPLVSKAEDAAQPENWFVKADTGWRYVGKLDVPTVAAFAEQPNNLWLQPGQKGDRVTAEWQVAQPEVSSLHLVRAEHVAVQAEVEHWPEGPKQKRRVTLRFAGHFYTFGLTDPEVQQRYFPDFPKNPHDFRHIKISPDGRALLTISLTPPFHGFHYKLVAAMIENQ